MREINVKAIENAVAELCVTANLYLPDDLVCLIAGARQVETSALGRDILGDMLENLSAADEMQIPVCQDTGMAVVFAELGQDVHIAGGSFVDAVNRGVSRGYTEGLLRFSVVADPLRRKNTGDNTPAVLHTELVPGDLLALTVAPKGFGSENMSAVRMFDPSADKNDIIAFVAETVKRAGGKPCPPVVVGAGIGGNFEYAAYLAKKALCRPVSVRNTDPFYARLEADILDALNRLNVGVQGFGGTTTALAVNIEVYPTHIAGLPVAVNIGCHVTRHGRVIL